jgi:hypothetical protein
MANPARGVLRTGNSWRLWTWVMMMEFEGLLLIVVLTFVCVSHSSGLSSQSNCHRMRSLQQYLMQCILSYSRYWVVCALGVSLLQQPVVITVTQNCDF